MALFATFNQDIPYLVDKGKCKDRDQAHDPESEGHTRDRRIVCVADNGCNFWDGRDLVALLVCEDLVVLSRVAVFIAFCRLIIMVTRLWILGDMVVGFDELPLFDGGFG